MHDKKEYSISKAKNIGKYQNIFCESKTVLFITGINFMLIKELYSLLV